MIDGYPFTNLGDAIALELPDAEAITFRDGDTTQRITFGEFNDQADAVASQLLARGLTSGERVAIVGRNSIEWLTAFYGVLRAGLVAVPLSFKFPPEVLRYALENSQSTLALVDDASRLEAVGAETPSLTFAEASAAPGVTPQRHRRDGSDAAMILYTSGSTGKPKGVVLSHDSHLWVLSLGQHTFGDATDVTAIVAAPLYHMNALANVQGALAAGRRVVIADGFDAQEFLRVVAAESVTRLTGVPPMFALLVQQRALIEELDLSSVQEVYMGSSPASNSLFTQLREAFPGAAIIFGYGTTESGPVAFTRHPQLPTPDGSVGVANPAVDVRLVDRQGREASQGELEIRTGALFTEYFRRPDVASPFTPDGYYRTGDEFRRDEHGFYFFTGRADDMFTSGGENVYPRAVEAALEAHDAVAEAVVVPVPDEVKGSKPVAFVVAAPGHVVDEAALKAWSLTKLEPYAHPRQVFTLDAMPLSQTNKVDRSLLAQRAREEVSKP